MVDLLVNLLNAQSFDNQASKALSPQQRNAEFWSEMNESGTVEQERPNKPSG
jgi:hypothetical protein